MQQFDHAAVIAATWKALRYLAWGWSLPVDRGPAGTNAPVAKATTPQPEARGIGTGATVAKRVDAI